jgi:hypothetical protein
MSYGYTRQTDGSLLSDKPTFELYRSWDGTVFDPPIQLHTRITDPEWLKREFGQALWESMAPACGEAP